MAVKKLWEEIREKLWEKNLEYILRVNKLFFEILTISDLKFMCTDKDVVRHLIASGFQGLPSYVDIDILKTF